MTLAREMRVCYHDIYYSKTSATLKDYRTQPHRLPSQNTTFHLDMASSNSSCWACTLFNTATCHICAFRVPKQKVAPSQPRISQHPQRIESLPPNTIQGPERMHLGSDLNVPNLVWNHEDLKNRYKMTTRTATPDLETYTATILHESVCEGTPSITLTGPTNDKPTMDPNTLEVLEPEHEVLVSSRIRITRTRLAQKKHERGPECAKCVEAAKANAKFAMGMRSLPHHLVKSRKKDLSKRRMKRNARKQSEHLTF
jgi:hypothetical protein